MRISEPVQNRRRPREEPCGVGGGGNPAINRAVQRRDAEHNGDRAQPGGGIGSAGGGRDQCVLAGNPSSGGVLVRGAARGEQGVREQSKIAEREGSTDGELAGRDNAGAGGEVLARGDGAACGDEDVAVPETERRRGLLPRSGGVFASGGRILVVEVPVPAERETEFSPIGAGSEGELEEIVHEQGQGFGPPQPGVSRRRTRMFAQPVVDRSEKLVGTWNGTNFFFCTFGFFFPTRIPVRNCRLVL